MNQSLFLNLVEKYFPGLVVQVYTEIVTNNSYTFIADLDTRFSITGTWESIGGINKSVRADVISLDASIPLKRANPIKTASGDIPKVATKRHLNETDLTMLQMLMSRDGEDTAQIRRQVFEHVGEVIKGQLEAYEAMYLSCLSGGGVLVVDTNKNVGTGIRVDFKMPTDNTFNASKVWGQPDYKPLTDISNMIENARVSGLNITRLKMDQDTFNKIKNSDEARALVYLGVDNPPLITNQALNDLLLSEYRVRVEIQDKVSVYEIDGVQTVEMPWKAGQIIGLESGKNGTFVWSEVAEMNFPSNLCNYQRTGNQNFILVKKYRTVDPALAEYTASESRALPVLDAQRMVKLDTTAVA